MGAESPPDDDDVFSVYLRAKAEADAALVAERPRLDGRATRHSDRRPGTGRVRIQAEPIRARSRATTWQRCWPAVLHEPRSARLMIYVVGGDDPIEESLARMLG